MQAGTFVFAHLLYCDLEASQCIQSGGQLSPSSGSAAQLWSRAQKGAALTLCLAGAMLYSSAPDWSGGKATPRPTKDPPRSLENPQEVLAT